MGSYAVAKRMKCMQKTEKKVSKSKWRLKKGATSALLSRALSVRGVDGSPVGVIFTAYDAGIFLRETYGQSG